jgi:hypothetical protein
VSEVASLKVSDIDSCERSEHLRLTVSPARLCRVVYAGFLAVRWTEPCLDCPSVVALLGERLAAGVAQHVRMSLEIEARGNRPPLGYPGKAGRR